jgi:hypothetical protein
MFCQGAKALRRLLNIAVNVWGSVRGAGLQVHVGQNDRAQDLEA